MSKYFIEDIIEIGDILEDESGVKLVVCKDKYNNCGDDSCYYAKRGSLGDYQYCNADHIDCYARSNSFYFKPLHDVQLPEYKDTGIDDKALNEIVNDVKNMSTDEYNELYDSASDQYDDLRDMVFNYIDNIIPEQHRKNFMVDMFRRYPDFIEIVNEMLAVSEME